MSPFPPHVVTAPGEQGTDDGSKEINDLDQQATPFASMQLHQDHLRWLLLLSVMVHVWAHDAYFVGLFLLLSFKLMLLTSPPRTVMAPWRYQWNDQLGPVSDISNRNTTP